MKSHLQENIRRCRREINLTQAQLAEAMGVTVGAVSKWESGASIPDIETLISLADFFQRSVDAMLGYRQLHTGGTEMAERIKACAKSGDLAEGLPLAQRALLRYPNQFAVVYRSASLFLVGGTVHKDPALLERAMELFYRAEGLLEQNNDPSIGRRTLMLHISECLHGLGRTDEALKVLSGCNDGGVNDYLIGHMLVEMERYEEARKPLSDSMMDCVWRLVRTVEGMANCLVQGDGNHAAALEQLHWLIALLDSLHPGTPCYWDRYTALLVAASAGGRMELGDRQGAEEALREARARALRYDSQPDGRMDLRYFPGKEAFAHDDLGQSAMEAVVHVLNSQGDCSGTLITLWNRMEQEARLANS